MNKPAFFDSEWFVPEVDNWHLKPGAPEEIVKEFEEYMNRDREAMERGVIVD